MTKVGTLRNKTFDQFEANLRAIQRMKQHMREDDYYDASGVPTKNKLLGLDQLFKFAHGNTKQKLTLYNYGKEKTYQRRTLRAFKRKVADLQKRTAGGMTIKQLLAGMDRKKSKTKDKKSPIYDTSRKQRIMDIKSVQFEGMKGNIAHFKVSASGMTPNAPSHYKFKMQFPGWSRARATNPGIRGVEQVLQEPVLIHDTCKDFQFVYGFVADTAGYAIESEQSYPKIKNPELQNTMCKHGGRTCEALLKGEFGLKIALANAMKTQAKKKQNADAFLWAQPEKSNSSRKKQKETEFKQKVKRKSKSVSAAAKAKKKADKSAAYKKFTQKEKAKLFKKLPKIVEKATSSKTVEKSLKDYAKKQKLDPKKVEKTGFQKILETYRSAARGAVKTKKKESNKAIQKAKAAGDKITEKSRQLRPQLFALQEMKNENPELYEMNLKYLAEKHDVSVDELKRMAK